MSFRKTNCYSLGGLFICESALGYFERDYYYYYIIIIIFGVRAAFGLGACCLFPRCVQAAIPLIGGVLVDGLLVLPGRRRQWAGPVASAWLLALDSGKDLLGGDAGCFWFQGPPEPESLCPAPTQVSQAVVSLGGDADGLGGSLSALPSSVQLLHFSLSL